MRRLVKFMYLSYFPAGKYWFPGRPEDVPHQGPQDVP